MEDISKEDEVSLKNQRGGFSHVQMRNQSARVINQSCHTSLIQSLITRVWQKGKKKDKYAGNTGTVRLFSAKSP